MPFPVLGVVRDARGRPVPEARVYFTRGPAPFPEIAAVTGADGSFVLPAPAPGTYRIECTVEGFPPTEATLEVSEQRQTEVELRVDR